MVSNSFPVWPRNRLITAGLEPVLNYTEKLCIASFYRQYSTNIKLKIIKLKPVLIAMAFGHAGLRKLVLNLKIFHFDIFGKLTIIRCDN